MARRRGNGEVTIWRHPKRHLYMVRYLDRYARRHA
jgi:hypothetical protein